MTHVGDVPVKVTVLEAAPAEEPGEPAGSWPSPADEPLGAGEFEPPSRLRCLGYRPRFPTLHCTSTETCPLAFHARYVLRMQSFNENPGSVSTGLGSAAHGWFQAWASGAELGGEREAALARRYELDERMSSRLSTAARRFVTSARGRTGSPSRSTDP